MTPEKLSINALAELHNGEDVFFSKTERLPDLFHFLGKSPRACVLISGNSARSITAELSRTAPDCVKTWFAQNAEADSHRLRGIPAGLENSHPCVVEGHGVAWKFAANKRDIIERCRECSPTSLVYANFSLETHGDRHTLAKACDTLDFVTLEVSATHQESKSRDFARYVQRIKAHHMVLCPRGVGVDTHRIWETLYLHRLPIVLSSPALCYFLELPIVCLTTWEELRNQALVWSLYKAARNNSRRMLDLGYWRREIAAARASLYDQ